MVTVVVIESRELMHDVVVHALSVIDDMTVIGYCVDGHAAVGIVLRERPDVIVMGMELSGMDGAETSRHIINAWPSARIVLHTSDLNTDRVRAAVHNGVVVVPENLRVETLARTIRAVAGGDRNNYPHT